MHVNAMPLNASRYDSHFAALTKTYKQGIMFMGNPSVFWYNMLIDIIVFSVFYISLKSLGMILL
jgi:hypothetical protein